MLERPRLGLRGLHPAAKDLGLLVAANALKKNPDKEGKPTVSPANMEILILPRLGRVSPHIVSTLLRLSGFYNQIPSWVPNLQ